MTNIWRKNLKTRCAPGSHLLAIGLFFKDLISHPLQILVTSATSSLEIDPCSSLVTSKQVFFKLVQTTISENVHSSKQIVLELVISAILAEFIM